MDLKEIHQANKDIHNLLDNSQLNDAFNSIDPLIQAAGTWTLREQIEQLRISYQLMLQYMRQGINDPKRMDVYNDIINKLHTITDSVTCALLDTTGNDIFFTRRRELNNVPLATLLHRQRAEMKKFALLTSVENDQQDTAAIATVIKQREIHETAIFNKIWSTFPLQNDDAQLIADVIADDDYPSYAMCLITSALFLGMMKMYDERKMQLLIDLYTISNKPQVQLRALTSVMLAMKLYPNRVKKSATLGAHFQAMTDSPQFANDFTTIQFQLARSRNTENVTRRMKEELMPGIMKLRPDMLNKLNADDISDITDLEANPEWQQMLEDSGIARKMEEFNEMQLDGTDVFISTFSQLKTFPFFQTLSNWFLPFHEHSSAIYGHFTGNDAPLLMVVTRVPFLCNSDRYSFSLSLNSMPDSQKHLIVEQIKAQVEQVGEMQNAELPDPKRERERQANMYVQDLYRFFKLFTRRREFIAAFDCDMDFTRLPILGDHTASTDALTIIAEFYFKNSFYQDAIKYYNYMLDMAHDANPLIYQKLGYCYQSMGNTAQALKNYKRYELANDEDLWTLKHIAACYRERKQYDNAIAYYKKIEQLKPDNVANVINMGHCMLEQGKVEQAMKIYFKADLMDENNHRARRPVAWCAFLLGNDERSIAYYDRIINEDSPSAQDYLNRAHALLAMKRMPDAIDSYTKALQLMNGKSEELRKAILSDSEALKSRGISIDDIPIIIDAITSN